MGIYRNFTWTLVVLRVHIRMTLSKPPVKRVVMGGGVREMEG